MAENNVIPSFGNHRIDQAANRLNRAFLALEQKLQKTTPANDHSAELELIEQENHLLHEELAKLKELLGSLDQQLADTEQELKQLMDNAS
jgi:septal ring factor EnvC (AmiA/AmiB activator)